MGIQNLLRCLKSIQIPRHLSYYRGLRVAIDAYCWLHKSIFTYNDEMFENPSTSKKYLIYLNKRLNQLLEYNITPILVFDGDHLPMKKKTEEERRKRRMQVNEESTNLLQIGTEKEAQYKKLEGYDVTPEMAYEFIKILKMKKIEYYIAPYEADSELSYLSKINYVDVVITEDSDLIAFGCKKILYKLDAETCVGNEIEYENIKNCNEYNFRNFNRDKFLTFCIAAGCDYFKLKGIGIKNAYNAIKNSISYKESINYLGGKSTNYQSNEEILIDFEKAFLTFRYQVVYCPIIKKLRYFNDIEKSPYVFMKKYINDLSFLGNLNKDRKIVEQITFGDINPLNKSNFLNDENFIGKKRNFNNNNNNNYFNNNNIRNDSKNYIQNNHIYNLIDIKNNNNNVYNKNNIENNKINYFNQNLQNNINNIKNKKNNNNYYIKEEDNDLNLKDLDIKNIFGSYILDSTEYSESINKKYMNNKNNNNINNELNDIDINETNSYKEFDDIDNFLRLYETEDKKDIKKPKNNIFEENYKKNVYKNNIKNQFNQKYSNNNNNNYNYSDNIDFPLSLEL